MGIATYRHLATVLTLAAWANLGRVQAAEPETKAAETEPKPWYEGQEVKPEPVGQTPASTTFGGKVYFGGQPSVEDLKAYKAKGVKTVINLRPATEMKIDEAAAAKAEGLEYLNIPFDGQTLPKPEDMDRLMNTLDDAEKQPVLLHCASSNRVGFMWSLFRARRHKLDASAAIAEGKKAGLKSPKLEEMARAELGKAEVVPAEPK